MTDRSLTEPSPEPSSGSRAGNRALSVMDLIRESILDGSVADRRTAQRGQAQPDAVRCRAPRCARRYRRWPAKACWTTRPIAASPCANFRSSRRRCLRHPRLAGRRRGALCRRARASPGRKGDHRAQPRRRRQTAGTRIVRSRRSHDLSRNQRRFPRHPAGGRAQPHARRNDPDLPSRPGVVEPQHRRLRVSRRPPPARRSSPDLRSDHRAGALARGNADARACLKREGIVDPVTGRTQTGSNRAPSLIR